MAYMVKAKIVEDHYVPVFPLQLFRKVPRYIIIHLQKILNNYFR